MTVRELRLSFNDGVDKASSNSTPEIPLPVFDRFMNLALDKWVKSRYGTTNSNRKGFEVTQKRTDDLRYFVEEIDLPPAPGVREENRAVSSTTVPLPDNYWLSVAESVRLRAVCRGSAQESTYSLKARKHDQVTVLLQDPFQQPSFKYIANTFRLMRGNHLVVYHPTEAQVLWVRMAYINEYKALAVGTTYTVEDTADPLFWETLPFWPPSATHREILNYAIDAALEAIEQPRLVTFEPTQLHVQE